jgi:hypothetical protein
MPKTLLLEKLLECDELLAIYESLPPSQERARLEKQRADCERIVCYLMERFASLNHRFANLDQVPLSSGPADAKRTQEELSQMEAPALLRYGSVLKYICAVEASLQDMSLEECTSRLRLAQVEWRRRFGNTVLADSI